MAQFKEIKDILKQHGFKQNSIENSLSKGKRYKATICNTSKVFITTYTPNYQRYLGYYEFEKIEELKEYLKINHGTI